MNYPGMQLDILQLFVDAQYLGSKVDRFFDWADRVWTRNYTADYADQVDSCFRAGFRTERCKCGGTLEWRPGNKTPIHIGRCT